ncbi:MAG: hypothetical protein DRG24_01735 [Epsilonproteobacteria bacterium]|nr:MAG: hypothetical protein DRG24_01735 [Campylobacterota bacterium]
MKTKTFFIGSILLISNLVYALPVQNIPRQRAVISQFDHALVAMISELLVSRGLERDVAEQKVVHLFGENINNAALNLHHFLHEFNTVSYDQAAEYLSQKALFDQQIDLASYDALLGMLQTLDFQLATTENYAKLHRMASLNKRFLKS